MKFTNRKMYKLTYVYKTIAAENKYLMYLTYRTPLGVRLCGGDGCVFIHLLPHKRNL